MKVENVVKPPQKPVVRNIRRSPFIKLPRSNKPYKSPIIKQPNTFTTMVPHGKPDAMLVWTACESKYLAIPPTKLPAPMKKRILNIIILFNIILPQILLSAILM